MTDTYAAGFLDGWATAAETLRTRFHLTARDAATGPRIDAERLGGVGGHSDPPEGKPWLVGPQEPVRIPNGCALSQDRHEAIGGIVTTPPAVNHQCNSECIGYEISNIYDGILWLECSDGEYRNAWANTHAKHPNEPVIAYRYQAAERSIAKARAFRAEVTE